MFEDPDNSTLPASDNGLGRHAQREAERRSPGYSHALHERIMLAVETSTPLAPEESRIVPRPPEPSAFRTGPAIAAVLVAGAALLILARAHLENVQPGAAAAPLAFTGPEPISRALTPVAAMQRVPANVSHAVAAKVAQEQFAGLDQDARRMTRYLVEQVPFRDEWDRP